LNLGLSFNIDDLLSNVEPWRSHKGVQSEDEENIGKKIKALGSLWDNSME
jgi:hypothetical protein